MCMCAKCTKLCASMMLLFGILFLLVDLGVWSFWGIQWWTVVLLSLGVVGFGTASCPDCQACCSTEKKKK